MSKRVWEHIPPIEDEPASEKIAKLQKRVAFLEQDSARIDELENQLYELKHALTMRGIVHLD